MAQASPYPRTVTFDPPIEPHSLEKALASLFTAHLSEQHPEFLDQYQALRVSEREYTGVGLYSDFWLPPGISRPPKGAKLRDLASTIIHELPVTIDGGGLSDAGATVLAYVRYGLFSCIEIAALGEGEWDGHLDGVRVYAVGMRLIL